MNAIDRLYMASLLEKQAMAAAAGNAVGRVGGMAVGMGQKIQQGFQNFTSGAQRGYTQGVNQATGVRPLQSPPVAAPGTMQFTPGRQPRTDPLGPN